MRPFQVDVPWRVGKYFGYRNPGRSGASWLQRSGLERQSHPMGTADAEVSVRRRRWLSELRRYGQQGHRLMAL